MNRHIVCFVYIIVIIQTESDIREEFKKAGIEVESRIFSTDGDPITVIEDLFVSHYIILYMSTLEFLTTLLGHDKLIPYSMDI